MHSMDRRGTCARQIYDSPKKKQTRNSQQQRQATCIHMSMPLFVTAHPQCHAPSQQVDLNSLSAVFWLMITLEVINSEVTHRFKINQAAFYPISIKNKHKFQPLWQKLWPQKEWGIFVNQLTAQSRIKKVFYLHTKSYLHGTSITRGPNVILEVRLRSQMTSMITTNYLRIQGNTDPM